MKGWAIGFRRGLLWMVGIGALGCAPCDSRFDEVEIHGGEEAERGIVRQALGEFAAWTGRDRICVEQIEVLEEPHDDGEHVSIGRYHSASRSIFVLGEQPHLFDTVVHELCHAVDHEDKITRRYRDTFVYDPQAFDHEDRSPRSRRREAMALGCEAGPDALAIAQAVAPVCSPQADVEFVSVLLDEVYAASASELPAAPALEQVALAEWALPDGWALTGPRPVLGTVGRDLWVRVVLPDGAGVARVDAQSGEFRGFADPSVGAFLPPVTPPSGGSYLWEEFTVGSWGGEAQLATFRWRLANGEVIYPLVMHDGEQWSIPDRPCGSQNGWLIDGDGAPWMVELDRRVLRWSAWER